MRGDGDNDVRGGTEARKVAVARALGEQRGLTRAQQRVLELVALGATREDIARETGTTLRTVKNHLEAVFDKLERVVPERSARAIENWVLDQALFEAVVDRPPSTGQPRDGTLRA